MRSSHVYRTVGRQPDLLDLLPERWMQAEHENEWTCVMDVQLGGSSPGGWLSGLKTDSFCEARSLRLGSCDRERMPLLNSSTALFA